MTLLIWLLFVVGVAYNVYLLRRMDLRRLDFMDGILLGQAYYLFIPMFFIFLRGETDFQDMGMSYLPFEDLRTTGVLLTGLYLLPTLRLLFPKSPVTVDLTSPHLLRFMLALFLVSSVLSFLMIGLSHGGNWVTATTDAFEGNPATVLIKHAANFSRTTVFGILVYRVYRGDMTMRRAIPVGVAIVATDLLLSFNRITAVYLLISILLMLRRRPMLMLSFAVPTMLVLSSVSALWPVIRSFATVQGYSVQGFQKAVEISLSQQGIDSPVDTALNSLFESSNIVVLNWVVIHTGTRLPYLNGQMYVRPATVLLPSSIWPDRPEGFGIILGKQLSNANGLALNSTLFGEPFANFGMLWPLGLTAFLFVLHMLFRMLAGQSRGIGFVATYTAIGMWRFDSSFVGISLILTFAMVFGLRFLWSRRTRKPVAKRSPARLSAGRVPDRRHLT